MPFPWKKSRITRISRIVADIPSPRHGGSLVVETGFPTSLIDLFFKNRERLKKPSQKRRNEMNRVEPEISDPKSPSSPSLLGFRPSISPTDSIDASSQRSIHRIVISESFEEEVERVGDRNQVEECGGESRGVFAAVLKVFVVVILAMSTKKLAVGITLSAFLLLILEFAGKHAVQFVKLGLGFFPRRENDLARRNAENVDHKSDSTEEELIEEIQSVEESNSERTDLSGREVEFLSREGRWGRLDGEESEEVSIVKNQSSRRAKLKAKIIKKLVPKKLRSVKKLKKMKKKEKDFEHESSFLDAEPEQDEEEEGELVVIEENKVTEREGDKGYVILGLTVLVGLVGGRIPAILMTVAGSFMLKSIKAQTNSPNLRIFSW